MERGPRGRTGRTGPRGHSSLSPEQLRVAKELAKTIARKRAWERGIAFAFLVCALALGQWWLQHKDAEHSRQVSIAGCVRGNAQRRQLNAMKAEIEKKLPGSHFKRSRPVNCVQVVDHPPKQKPTPVSAGKVTGRDGG